MNVRKSATVLAAAVLLVFVAQAPAANPTRSSSSYTVAPTSVPGVDTGLILKSTSVTVTATGSVCPYGTSFCIGPDGSGAIDTTQSGFAGFVLPGAPAWGLVGRVGGGAWVQVGSGPTTLSGSGDLEFAVNDDLLSDNTGSFTVTVSYSRRSVSLSGTSSCWPGWGYGDANHVHHGPPSRDPQACYPGHGYGDTNHDHDGPPGRQTQEPSGAASPNGNTPHTPHLSSSDRESSPGKHR